MAVNLNSEVKVVNLNTVTPAQLSINYGPVFAVNGPGGAPEDHDHSEYVRKDAVTINGQPLEGDISISEYDAAEVNQLIDNLSTSLQQEVSAVADDLEAADQALSGRIDTVEDTLSDESLVRSDDERLSDARVPLSHRHDYADIDNAPAIPTEPGDIGAQPAGNYILSVNGFEADPNGDVVIDTPTPLDGMSGVVVVRSGDMQIPASTPPGTLIVQIPGGTEFVRMARLYVHSGDDPVPGNLPIGTVVVRTN